MDHFNKLFQLLPGRYNISGSILSDSADYTDRGGLGWVFSSDTTGPISYLFDVSLQRPFAVQSSTVRWTLAGHHVIPRLLCLLCAGKRDWDCWMFIERLKQPRYLFKILISPSLNELHIISYKLQQLTKYWSNFILLTTPLLPLKHVCEVATATETRYHFKWLVFDCFCSKQQYNSIITCNWIEFLLIFYNVRCPEEACFQFSVV